jgi:Family of unknown function (DUF5723)
MKNRLFLLLLLFVFDSAQSQDFLGYGHSRYAGIVGASYNPATLADNVYSTDILLCGLGIEAGNNYVGVRRADIFRSDFGSKYLVLRDNPRKKAAFVRAEVLLPGIMFSNEKFGWGIDMKIRSYTNADGLPQPLSHILAFEINDPPNFNKEYYSRHIGINSLTWAEIGGTYAKTVFTGAEHYVSIGFRPKFLLGLNAIYANINDATYEFYNDSTLYTGGTVTFGHSNDLTFNNGLQPSWGFKFNPGIGLDAGIIYEHRPEVLNSKKDDSKKKKEWPGFRERPLYQYRIGASLTDLGIIHFRHGELSDSYDFYANVWDIDDKTIDTTSPPPLFGTFELRNGGSKEGNALWMRLPLALNLQFDYRITNDLYINVTSFNALYVRNVNYRRVHELTRFSVTARWERRWFGAWMPLSFSRFGILSLGGGVRIGPLIIGTTDILVYALRKKPVYSADLYFALKIPLFPVGSLTKKGKAKKKDGKVDDCAK